LAKGDKDLKSSRERTLPTPPAPLRRLLLVAAVFMLLPAGMVSGDEPDTPSPVDEMSAREEAALELVVNLAISEDPEEKKAGIRRLAGYRFGSVAFALVQMLEEETNEVSVIQEVEWALVSMPELALGPLAAAVDEGAVPTDMALLIFTRIARRDPTILVPYMKHKNPDVARGATLGIAVAGHRSGRQLLLESFDLLPSTSRQVIVQALCHVRDETCHRLLVTALGEDDEELQTAVLGIAQTTGLKELSAHCLPLLHSPNPVVVRAALETMVTLGAEGGEKDLEILFDAAPPDVKEQVVRVMASTRTNDAYAFLKKVIGRYSSKTELGKLAHTLYRESAGREVRFGGGSDTVPVEASIARSGLTRYSLVLYNQEGYRVVVSGTVMSKCPGSRGRWQKAVQTDFSSDGSFPVTSRCSGGRTPEVIWKTRTGTIVRAAQE